MAKKSASSLVQVSAAQVIPTTPAGALMQVIERAAMDPTFDVTKLAQLLDVKERWDATEAKKAFVAAMVAFKANPPTVEKRKHVHYQPERGKAVDYHHARLEDVCEAAIKGLADVGISHTWSFSQDDAGQITVSCILTHALGHSERTTLKSPPDTSAGKNSIQAISSTVTYLERYTLLGATGLAAGDMDDDGRGAGKSDCISAMQEADLVAMADEVGADMGQFLAWLGIEKLADLPANRMRYAVSGLNEKRKANAAND
jgi:hypothetical protein